MTADALLDRLEQRAAMQRMHRRYEVLSQHRIDPDLADPWAPEIVLVEQQLTVAHRARLNSLINAEPRVTTGRCRGRTAMLVPSGRCVDDGSSAQPTVIWSRQASSVAAVVGASRIHGGGGSHRGHEQRRDHSGSLVDRGGSAARSAAGQRDLSGQQIASGDGRHRRKGLDHGGAWTRASRSTIRRSSCSVRSSCWARPAPSRRARPSSALSTAPGCSSTREPPPRRWVRPWPWPRALADPT